MDKYDEIELSLICCLFVNRDAITRVYDKLTPEMFVSPELGLIYKAACALFQRGVQPDMPLVAKEIQRIDSRQSTQLGGLRFLLPELKGHRLDYNLMNYVDDIRERYNLDCLGNICDESALESRCSDARFQNVMEALDKKLMALREKSAVVEQLRSIGEVANEVVERHTRRRNENDETFRMMSGFTELDGLMGGLHRGELTVLGGTTSSGKTSVAMAIAQNIAKCGWSVLHFSMEMTPEQTMNRFFSGEAGIDANLLRIGGLKENDLVTMSKYALNLKNLRYYFVYNTMLSVESLRAQAYLMARKELCDVIVVDYLQLLSRKPEKGETLENVISQNICALKMLAGELNCAVLVVSQLNREISKRGSQLPMLSDLRDSGAIEQVADCVVILQGRTDQINESSSTSGGYRGLKLYLLKNRNGGTGSLQVFHNESFTHFINNTSKSLFGG